MNVQSVDSDFSELSDLDSDDDFEEVCRGSSHENVLDAENDSHPNPTRQSAKNLSEDEGFSEFFGEKMSMPIAVNGLLMNGLIDTGAQICCINQEMADILRLKTTSSINIKGIDDQPIVAKLCPRVTLKIGHKSFNWHVFVAPI